MMLNLNLISKHLSNVFIRFLDVLARKKVSDFPIRTEAEKITFIAFDPNGPRGRALLGVLLGEARFEVAVHLPVLDVGPELADTSFLALGRAVLGGRGLQAVAALRIGQIASLIIQT
jgi:hypothetical protein